MHTKTKRGRKLKTQHNITQNMSASEAMNSISPIS